ncbi:ubiquitin activating enzyme family protein [Salix suchowensis]|nr:ubiquitin activating enzyme family protein [Salix suchowensis]
MIIPHLTENYGASRDPPEKQAPMCTVHSFPHNIDHCLTWARSEFEGLVEKTPAEVNAYLSNPVEYINAMNKDGDAQSWTLWNMFLSASRRKNDIPCSGSLFYSHVVSRFEDYFADHVKQLIFTFPEEASTSTGAPFWSAPKRFPHPLQFSVVDPSHLNFVMAASILRAETFGISVPEWVKHPKTMAEAVGKVIVPEFQPREDVKIETDEKATTLGAIVADLSVLITPVEDYQLPPEALSSKLAVKNQVKFTEEKGVQEGMK